VGGENSPDTLNIWVQIAPQKKERLRVMVSSVTSADFVPVDAVFSGDGSSYQLLSAGERLREARVKAGLTLDSAAARTRIRRDYLEALETMDPRGLPARAYAIGYLRTYSGFLSLDAVSLVDQFKREVDTETGRAQPTAAAQVRNPIKLPRGLFGAAIILASVASIVWWYSDQTSNTEAFDNVPSPPDAAPAWAREDFPARTARTSIENIWSGLPLSQAAMVTGALILRAQAPTWLEVQDASGRILFSRQLEIGEIYQIRENGLTLSTLDAGAIELEAGGEILGRLGESGAVIENMPVLAENLPQQATE
jgi:cytoskeleton protein RodZ